MPSTSAAVVASADELSDFGERPPDYSADPDLAPDQDTEPPASAPMRVRDQLLWIVPPAGIVLAAVLGDRFGPYAVLLAVVGVVTAYGIITGLGVLGRRATFAVGLAATLLGAGVVVAHDAGLAVLQPKPRVETKPPTVVAAALARAKRGEPLDGIVLDRQQMTEADLHGVAARGASLRETILTRAHLPGADLRGIRAEGVDLRWADLRGADLRGADLISAKLQWACLEGADLTGAVLDKADATGAATRGAAVPDGITKDATSWPAAPAARPGSCG